MVENLQAWALLPLGLTVGTLEVNLACAPQLWRGEQESSGWSEVLSRQFLPDFWHSPLSVSWGFRCTS